jgi:hypothetical protein
LRRQFTLPKSIIVLPSIPPHPLPVLSPRVTMSASAATGGGGARPVWNRGRSDGTSGQRSALDDRPSPRRPRRRVSQQEAHYD